MPPGGIKRPVNHYQSVAAIKRKSGILSQVITLEPEGQVVAMRLLRLFVLILKRRKH